MFEKLTDIIVNYVEVNKEDIKPESRFMEDLGFTSFDFMSMLGEIEDELDVEIVQEEAAEIRELLSGRLDSAVARGWFPDKADKVLNEASLIDTDGRMLRPDRVVISDGKVVVVDYKFGEHHTAYERQLRRYSDIWRRMGYKDVSAFLWYVHTDEVREV